MADPAHLSTGPDAGVVELCSRLIRFDTSNYGAGEAAGEREAAEFVAAELSRFDPVLLESAPRRANVVARVPGLDRTAPAVLVHGHLDVVPAVAAEWTVPPFAGEVRDGYLWGRGAVDMKDMCAMTLSVVRSWAARGVRPRRDVVLAFVADEEVTGELGARWLVAEHPSLFDGCAVGISETGGYTFGVDGVRLYPIAAAERGIMHLRLEATGRAGHGSRPNPANAVTALVDTVSRLAAHQWPIHLTPVVRAYLEQAGAALGVHVDDSDLDGTIAKLGRAGILAEGVVRNTVTPTMLRAGYKVNVIPAAAEANLDVRVLPGTAGELLSTVDSLLAPGVTRTFVERTEPVSAPVDSPWFAAMADALRAEDPAAVVVPYCMGGGTDAKAFAKLGIAGYGFAPLLLPTDPDEYDYRAMAHGVDERVPLSALPFGARVLDRFLLIA
jgi:acetylornithine deacetylase/succinyl-diaminopimelate desuccinylase-like protein